LHKLNNYFNYSFTCTIEVVKKTKVKKIFF